MGLLSTLTGILQYKEPRDPENGFELLENEDKSKPASGQPEPGGSGTVLPGASGQSDEKLPGDLNSAIQTLSRRFSLPKNQDVVIRQIRIGRQISAALIFVEGMIDKKILDVSLLPHLMSPAISQELSRNQANVADFLLQNVLTVHSISKETSYDAVIRQILNGVTALLIDGSAECLLIESRGYEKRAVESPKTESVVKGSQEGFTENLRTNVTLLRRIVKNEHLITEMLPTGNTADSSCALLYIDGVANSGVIDEIKKRIAAVDVDAIFSEGMKEQFIEDRALSLLPQVLSTERPDRCASFLLNGQVVLISDGAPYAMAVPVTFFQLFHTSEDSNIRWIYASMLRVIRIFGFVCALLLPGLYCSVVLYHPEMIPTELLTSIAQAKETVPFPTVTEILILEIAFELIREGAIRVPGVIGQTLGIVGALILGQAAVQAGLVSPVLVIVVSVTALGSFSIPNYQVGLAARIGRFVFLFAGAAFGFFGVSLMLFLIVVSASSIKSFGVPFLSPIAPKTNTSGSVLMRSPVWEYRRRPDYLNTGDTIKQGQNPKTWS